MVSDPCLALPVIQKPPLCRSQGILSLVPRPRSNRYIAASPRNQIFKIQTPSPPGESDLANMAGAWTFPCFFFHLLGDSTQNPEKALATEQTRLSPLGQSCEQERGGASLAFWLGLLRGIPHRESRNPQTSTSPRPGPHPAPNEPAEEAKDPQYHLQRACSSPTLGLSACQGL